MEIFNPSRYAIGLNSNIKVNNFGKNVYFGQTPIQDSFQSTSPLRLFNENEIKKLISQNPDLKKLLSENKLPIRLNMMELHELSQKHCKNTQDIAASIVNYLPQALKQQVNIKDLKDGAMLHDFGKVLIPPEILNKNGALTPEENRIMDLHSELGYQILKNSGVNNEVLNLVRYHHDNKQKDFVPDINLQILNLADKYSALTEERVYKEAFSSQRALTILYGEVKKGYIHPFLFNALVKSVSPQTTLQKIS